MPNFYWTDGENLPAQNFNFGDYSYIDGKQVLAVGRPNGVTYFYGGEDPNTAVFSSPVQITDDTKSTNDTSGALIVSGGVASGDQITGRNIVVSSGARSTFGDYPLNNVYLSPAYFAFRASGETASVFMDLMWERLLNAPRKYSVTYTNVTNGQNVFDGFSETFCTISAGQTAVWEIDVNPLVPWTANTNTGFVTADGSIIINQYTSPARADIQSVTLELYRPISGVDTWESQGTRTPSVSFPERAPIVFNLAFKTWVKKIRITIVANATIPSSISTIWWAPSRVRSDNQDQPRALQSAFTSIQRLYGPGLQVTDNAGNTSALKVGQIDVNGDKVLGPKETGWTAGSGTANKGSFDTSTATLQQVAERLLAIEQMARTHGLID